MKIIILIPYFGKFPEWSDLFFETLKRNKTIDFFFYTDCDIEKYQADNILYQKISFEEYVNLFNAKLDFKINVQDPYKICDLRPLFGYVHQDIFKGYNYYGWTDMDIFFGDIRSFYTDNILSNFDVFSTHDIRISGHFALFKNIESNWFKFKEIYNWKQILKTRSFIGIDEHGLSNAYFLTLVDKINIKFKMNINNYFTNLLSKIKKRKLYLKEQYTTPFTSIPWIDGSINSNHPNVWYYIDGKITNNRDENKEFMYLHLMNFKNSQYRHDGTRAPWSNKEIICFAKSDDMTLGVIIDESGIRPLNNS